MSCLRCNKDFCIKLSTACETFPLDSMRSSTMSAAVSLPGLLYRKLIIVASISESRYVSQIPLSMLSCSLIIRRMLVRKSVGRFMMGPSILDE